MNSSLSDFQKIIGVKFNNELLLRTALTHRSTNNRKDVNVEHNERLEFLGDAVLELLVTEYLFEKFPNEPEGFLTSIRAATVKTESLASEAGRLEYGKYLYMSKGEEATGGRTRPYILANTFEAIVGAMYLDQGLDTVRKFLNRELFYKIQDIAENRTDIDAKSKLQEIAQEELKVTPYYVLIGSSGPDHDKQFKMRVVLSKVRCGIGTGKSKQTAEQMAAERTLENWDKYKEKVLNNKN